MNKRKVNSVTDIRETVIDLQRRIRLLNSKLKDRELYDDREFGQIVNEVKSILELIESQPKGQNLDHKLVDTIVDKLKKIAE